MKKLLLILFLLPLFANATDYYVSNAGNNSNAGTSSGASWQSLSKVATVWNAGSIHAGDRILFKRGDQFFGSVAIQSIFGGSALSGTAGNPITIGAYGTGAKPLIMYPVSGGGSTPEGRTILSIVGVDYVTIKNIHFTDLTGTGDKVAGARCGFPIYLGSFGDATTNHCLIDSVDIDSCGMGVVIIGDFDSVTNCHMGGFKNLKSTSGGGGEDYGANPFTIIWANNTYIANNYVTDGWSESLDFGYNGGFCETIGSCSNNKIMYNTLIDCNGLSEFGQGGTSSNNLYAYNKLINCGAMFWVNSDTQVSNCGFYQNTVVEDDNSRFSQGSPNAGAGVTTPEAISHLNVDQYFVGMQSQSATTVFDLRNNILQIAQSGSPDMVLTNGGSKTAHTYNLDKLSGISGGYSLNTGELTTSSAIFVNTTGSASTWNYNLVSGSPAIAKGLTISGLTTTDIAGNNIGSPPNLGAYGPTAPTNVITMPVYIISNGVTYGPYQSIH